MWHSKSSSHSPKSQYYKAANLKEMSVLILMTECSSWKYLRSSLTSRQNSLMPLQQLAVWIFYHFWASAWQIVAFDLLDWDRSWDCWLPYAALLKGVCAEQNSRVGFIPLWQVHEPWWIPMKSSPACKIWIWKRNDIDHEMSLNDKNSKKSCEACN